MGASTSKQGALKNGISNQHIGIYPKISIPRQKSVSVALLENRVSLIIESEETPGVPGNKLHEKIYSMYPVSVKSSNNDLGLYQHLEEEEEQLEEHLQNEELPPLEVLSKIPVRSQYEKQMVKSQRNSFVKENSRASLMQMKDINANYEVNVVKTDIKTVQIQSSYSIQESEASTVASTAVLDNGKKKKLIIRGLKRFCESRGSSYPPTWVKEFPCKSKYHPDNYVYDWEEGPKAVKRNTPLMNRCPKQGGRCGTCGIYAEDVCRLCRKCDLDCGCPKLPKIPDFVGQLCGTGATWSPKSEKGSRDFAGEEISRQYGAAANYPYYSQQPSVPPPCYPSYPYYSQMPYNYPPVYPGYYPPPPPSYGPMPAQSPAPNYYSPTPNYNTCAPVQDQTNYGQPPSNTQTSFNMSFYE